MPFTVEQGGLSRGDSNGGEVTRDTIKINGGGGATLRPRSVRYSLRSPLIYELQLKAKLLLKFFCQCVLLVYTSTLLSSFLRLFQFEATR